VFSLFLSFLFFSFCLALLKMDGVSAQTTSVPASLKVSYKCDALAYHPQSRLLAISSSNLTGATWSGLITLAALSDTYTPTKPPTTLDTGIALSLHNLCPSPPKQLTNNSHFFN
jgi:hypothetical protein